MKEDQIEIAKKRVKEKKEFFEHLSSFLTMSGFFFLLNAITSFGQWWFFWPILGWGIAVILHYFSVFGIPGVGHLDKNWEQQALKKELDKLSRESHNDFLDLKDDFELKQPIKKARSEKKWDEDDLV